MDIKNKTSQNEKETLFKSMPVYETSQEVALEEMTKRCEGVSCSKTKKCLFMAL